MPYAENAASNAIETHRRTEAKESFIATVLSSCRPVTPGSILLVVITQGRLVTSMPKRGDTAPRFAAQFCSLAGITGRRGAWYDMLELQLATPVSSRHHFLIV